MSLAVLADHMASKGRGPDSMLIHMSPREVQGLQALAKAHGGSLTVNPETGLPEAGFLDKLLPTILGAGLSLIPGVGPLMAAGIVGGIQTVRTGDIGKGLAAGLGAYGGANLTAGLTEAGASTIGANEAAKGLAMTPELAAELQIAGEGAKDTLLQQQVADRVATATPYEKLSAGFDAFKANPTGMTKSLASPLMMAAGPAILAGANVQAKGPQTVTKPGMIRPYAYDPYGGTYTAGTPYEAAPTRSAGGGLMGLAAGGMAGYGDGDDVPRRNGMAQGGMFDFAQRSEPVVRMAEGGIVALAAGGPPPKVFTDEELYQQTGDWNKAAALRDAQNVAVSQYNATNNPTVGANINQWIVDNPFATAADINKAITSAGLTQDIVNPYLTANQNISAATRYALSHANEMPGAGGLAGMQANILKGFAAPNLTQAQIDTEQRKYGISDADIQSPLTHGYQIADTDLAKATNYLQSNPDVQAWLSSAEGRDYIRQHPEFDASDIAYTHYMRYGKGEGRTWEEAAKKPIVCGPGYRLNAAGTACEPIPVTPPPPPFSEVTPTGFYGNNTGNPLTSTPGDITSNPDGTVTVQPNIPGRPTGGFPGMASVRDAYTAGGGSLGYVPYAPKTIEEFEAKYNTLTGGSADAYNYLTGKTKYSPIPSTPTGEIMKPYWESVGRFPVNTKTKKYIFKDGKYVLNPDYVKPSYVLAGEKAAADKTAATDAAKAGAAEGKSINVINNQGNTESAYMREDGFYYTSSGNKFDEKGVQLAADGGLMAMARGGMAQQFNLGDYSDGGRLLRGPGDGVSDSIPATIGNKRPARLADGEFVVPARIVSELGNGSTEAGARKLYAMMDRIQKARRGTVGKGRVAKNSRSEKYLPA